MHPNEAHCLQLGQVFGFIFGVVCFVSGRHLPLWARYSFLFFACLALGYGVLGYVLERRKLPATDSLVPRLKPVIAIVEDAITINDEQLRTVRWMSERYLTDLVAGDQDPLRRGFHADETVFRITKSRYHANPSSDRVCFRRRCNDQRITTAKRNV